MAVKLDTIERSSAHDDVDTRDQDFDLTTELTPRACGSSDGWGYPWSLKVAVNGIREQPRRVEAVRRTRLQWNHACSRTPEGHPTLRTRWSGRGTPAGDVARTRRIGSWLATTKKAISEPRGTAASDRLR